MAGQFPKKMLRQKATYWAPATEDGFGGTSFAAKTTIKCRWEDKAVLFPDDSGVEIKSNAVVYVDRTLLKEGYLFLGTTSSTDPLTLVNAYEIRKSEEYPTVDGRRFERKVIL